MAKQLLVREVNKSMIVGIMRQKRISWRVALKVLGIAYLRKTATDGVFRAFCFA